MKRLLGFVMAIAAAALLIIGTIMLSNEQKHAESIYSGATFVERNSRAAAFIEGEQNAGN